MKKYIIKKYPFVDGRIALREFDLDTDEMRLMNIPQTSDTDIAVKSYKYPTHTLGDIAEVDKDYLKWIVTSSKAPDRIKKSAARLYFGVPYFAKKEGDIINESELYDPTNSQKLIQELCQK